MNDAQIAALSASLERVRLIESEAAALFYDELFQQKPSLRARFAHTDMERLKRELMNVIKGVVEYLEARSSDSTSANDFMAKLHALGQRHRHEWNVHDDDYEIAKQAFLNVLNKAFEKLWNRHEDLKLREIDAWTAMFDWLADMMILGANERDGMSKANRND